MEYLEDMDYLEGVEYLGVLSEPFGQLLISDLVK
jgi:hypothetical protein